MTLHPLDICVIDLFAGGGGVSRGVYLATGAEPLVAINHNPRALEMHAANHKHTLHLCEDVWEVKPFKPDDRNVDLIWASPDCFPAGTLVLTPKGLSPIEEIQPGDLVLTHRNRWRPVRSTNSHTADTVSVKGYGHFGLVTTANHPFYSKHRVKRPSAKPGEVRNLLENPYWPRADRMTGKLWATPHTFPDSFIPTCEGAQLDDAFFYFVGRWLGDGSLNKGDVEICCGQHELAELCARFAKSPLRRADGTEIKFRIVDHGASSLLVWGSAALTRWLETNFGVYCEGKFVPFWALAMQRAWRQALLAGYVDSDGSTRENLVAVSTVSKRLAIGIRLLACSLGFSPALYRAAGRQGVIEGRTFQGKDSYRVHWRDPLTVQTVDRDSRHLFTPVREVSTAPRQLVFSLEVEEDESYTADGIVVHNCTHHAKAKGAKPLDANIRGLCWSILPWLSDVRPGIFCLENVAEFESYGPLYPSDHPNPKLRDRPIPEQRGTLFKAFVAAICKLGYEVEWRVLNACDYGAPTIRRRLIMIARRDGQPIQWPRKTHGPGLRPFRTAAECIDFTKPCPSIFERERSLAENTLHRLAAGVEKFVLRAPAPFIVDGAVPNLVSTRNGERKGQAPRVRAVDSPMWTVTAQGSQGALQLTRLVKGRRDDPRARQVMAFLMKYYGQGTGQHLDEPLHTVMSKARFGLVVCEIAGEDYTIVDIGFRMLTPRELARGQGFDDSYVLTGGVVEQTARIGNSVPPQLAAAVVGAQFNLYPWA